ncbi:hypothetical protein [Streptomyces sp. NPDC048606]|uniref:hypothetical protein n=1 Tax=Streptomyces sp. NPDC048606 TaxID=3154726 RepID=UPI00343F549A
MTANCDLALGKHWGTLTYVPALPIDTYVREFTVPKILTRESQQSEREVRRCLDPNGTGAAAERAVEMVQLDYPVSDIATLLVKDDRKRSGFSGELEVLRLYRRTLSRLEESPDAAGFWRVVMDFIAEMDTLKPTKRGKEHAFRAEIGSSLKSLPGDAFYLHAPSPNHGPGYVAVLRLIRSIADAAVALRQADEIRGRGQYAARRVARLDTLYCHRVVQQMAGVFTDIGLPSDYETARDSHFIDYVDVLGKSQ